MRNKYNEYKLVKIFFYSIILTVAFSGKLGAQAFVQFQWSGAVTPTSVLIKAKVNGNRTVRAALSPDSAFTAPVYSAPVAVDSTTNWVAPFQMNGLIPNTKYYYAIESNGIIDTNYIGKFTTFPDGDFASFMFIFGADASTGSNHPVFDAIRNADPLFFLHIGDIHYNNIVVNDVNLYRQAFDTVMGSYRQSLLYRNVPIAYMWDDHDYSDNNSDSTTPSRLAARLTYQEYVPHYPLPAGSGDVPVYQTFTVGRVKIILTDLRSEKSAISMPDDSLKSMLGAQQKAWLKQELLSANRNRVIILLSTVPWIAPAVVGEDDWGGYTTERRELSDFMVDNSIENVIIICGDGHMLAIDDGTNNQYATNGGPGYPVIHSAAFDRSGSIKGGPFTIPPVTGRGHFTKATITDNGGSRVNVSFSGLDYLRGEIMSISIEALLNPVSLWNLRLNASVDTLHTNNQLLGVAVNATDGYDFDFDLPIPATPPTNYLQLYFPHPEWANPLGSNFSQDFRAVHDLSDANLQWDFEVITDKIGLPVTLDLFQEQIPAGYGKILYDLDNGQKTVLTDTTQYIYTGTALRRFRVAIGDSTPPVVQVTFPDGGEILEDTVQTIRWTADDGSGIDQFEIYYSIDGGSSFQLLGTQPGGQTNFDWPPPATLSFHTQIKVVAVDSMGNRGSDASNTDFIISPQLQATTYNPGWNLISLPLQPVINLTSDVIGDDVSQFYLVYEYGASTGYTQAPTVNAGKAYWLASLETLTVDVTGHSLTDTTIIPLANGWNLIGNPFVFDIPKTAIGVRNNGNTVDFQTAVSSGWVSAILYGYRAENGSYSIEDTLRAWSGHWVAAGLPGIDLVFYPQNSVNKTTPHNAVESSDGWKIALKLFSNAGSDLISAFGVNSHATDDYDPTLDNPEPPSAAAGNQPQVYFPHPDWSGPSGGKFNFDVRAPIEPGESKIWYFEVVNCDSARLEWDEIPVSGYHLTLTDLDANYTLDMNRRNTYPFYSSDAVHHFQVEAGNIATAIGDSENRIPKKFALYQNYPNPFNPATVIQYDLPEAGPVTIEVYNYLGQLMKTLVNERQPAGRYRVSFDAGRLASGIYLYRIRTGNKTAERKMLLIK